MQQYLDHDDLICRIGLRYLKEVNVFYRCESCHFLNRKTIVSFSTAVQEVAREWGVPYAEYSKVFDQMSVDGLSRFLDWQAVI